MNLQLCFLENWNLLMYIILYFSTSCSYKSDDVRWKKLYPFYFIYCSLDQYIKFPPKITCAKFFFTVEKSKIIEFSKIYFAFFQSKNVLSHFWGRHQIGRLIKHKITFDNKFQSYHYFRLQIIDFFFKLSYHMSINRRGSTDPLSRDIGKKRVFFWYEQFSSKKVYF